MPARGATPRRQIRSRPGGRRRAPRRWVLAIDLGTSTCVAAIRTADDPPAVVDIGGSPLVPSIVAVSASGELVTGHRADDLAAADPSRALRSPLDRLGDPGPVMLGERPWAATALVAAVLAGAADEATTQVGHRPSEVRLVHPASWTPAWCHELRRAGLDAGLPDPILVPAPVALASAVAGPLPAGTHVATFDLGAGRCEAVVLAAGEGGTWTVVGPAAGEGNRGGDCFDELLLDRIWATVDPATLDALTRAIGTGWDLVDARSHREARATREALSSSAQADMAIPTAGGTVRVYLTRRNLEELIVPYLLDSVDGLRRSLVAAGVEASGLAAIHLAGGASATPMTETVLREAFPGVPVVRSSDPQTAVALGALQTGLAATPARPRAPRAQHSMPAAAEPRRAGAMPAAAEPRRAESRRGRWALIPAVAVLAAMAIALALYARAAPPSTPATARAPSGPTAGSTAAQAGGRAGSSAHRSARDPATVRPSPPATTRRGPLPPPTQAQLQSAVLTAAQLGRYVTAVPGGSLCGDYPQPAAHALAEYRLANGGQLETMVGTWPSARAAAAALTEIPSSVPACTEGAQPYSITVQGAAPRVGDQSYVGEGSGFLTSGAPFTVYLGVVRDGRNLAVFEVRNANTAVSLTDYDELFDLAVQALATVPR